MLASMSELHAGLGNGHAVRCRRHSCTVQLPSPHLSQSPSPSEEPPPLPPEPLRVDRPDIAASTSEALADDRREEQS